MAASQPAAPRVSALLPAEFLDDFLLSSGRDVLGDAPGGAWDGLTYDRSTVEMWLADAGSGVAGGDAGMLQNGLLGGRLQIGEQIAREGVVK